VLVAIFIFNLTVPALLISAFTRDVLKGSQICMFLSVPTLLTAGYVWPEYMMPEPLIIGVKLFWPLIYYAGPARDVLVKGVPFHVIWPYVWQGLLYGIIWIPLAVAIYKKRLQVSQE
jgi:ABC-2 type transport system permease protein